MYVCVGAPTVPTIVYCYFHCSIQREAIYFPPNFVVIFVQCYFERFDVSGYNFAWDLFESRWICINLDLGAKRDTCLTIFFVK